MNFDRAELARYLGRAEQQFPPELEAFADQCGRELLQIAPRHAVRRIARAELPFDSGDLARHLDGCDEVFLTALTLGSEADRLLRLWSAQNMGKAAVGQALMAVYMDECCEALWASLEKGLQGKSYLLPAYSPGYGDFSLHWQERLLSLLDAPRRIGLSLSEGGMLLPEKSVTAVVGLTDTPARRCVQHCQNCTMQGCLFRKGS